jgi:hypothetical protein
MFKVAEIWIGLKNNLALFSCSVSLHISITAGFKTDRQMHTMRCSCEFQDKPAEHGAAGRFIFKDKVTISLQRKSQQPP